MKTPLATLLLLGLLGVVTADDCKLEDGYTNLFNGQDFTGWKYGDVPPKMKPPTEVLDGKTESSDKRFEVRDSLIVANIGNGAEPLYGL